MSPRSHRSAATRYTPTCHARQPPASADLPGVIRDVFFAGDGVRHSASVVVGDFLAAAVGARTATVGSSDDAVLGFRFRWRLSPDVAAVRAGVDRERFAQATERQTVGRRGLTLRAWRTDRVRRRHARISTGQTGGVCRLSYRRPIHNAERLSAYMHGVEPVRRHPLCKTVGEVICLRIHTQNKSTNRSKSIRTEPISTVPRK